MIEFNRNYQLAPNPADTVKIKVIGLGGAGTNALDRMLLDGIENADLVAINTDVQALTSSVASGKIQLGRQTTRGLGAGGDPELGLAAAEEAIDEIRQVIDGAGMIFLTVGLGGGTGSGAAPLIVNLAREQGALVVAFATMPFSFEGKRRARQAGETLLALQETADAVICFENDKMGDAVALKVGIHQPFAAADLTLSQSVKAISGIFNRPGLIHIGFDDLAAALRARNARCVFGFGEADGDNRAHDALARALKNPLMDRGRMLSDAQNVLVNVAGGPDMTLNEVQILMEELGKHVRDETQILFGTSVDVKMGERLSVTIISSIGCDPAPSAHAAPNHPAVFPEIEMENPQSEFVETPPEDNSEIFQETTESEQQPFSAPDEEQIEPVVPPAPFRAKLAVAKTPKINPPPALVPAKAAEPKQETLQFEAVTRGRFEKSEPTIVDGQDLDVPTFLRRNIKVK